MKKQTFTKTNYEKAEAWSTKEQANRFKNHKKETNNHPECIHESTSHVYNENDIFDNNLDAEFNRTFATTANKVKQSFLDEKESVNFESELAEFIFYTELFLAKNLLYFILKKGIKKGYKWTKL